tara:strand:- start:439 stop:630 length:192 start_codon:yes stop_codon:yes gene_type:complete
MSWKKHCKRKGIKFEWENSTDVFFTAPSGHRFANESRHRIIQDIEEVFSKEDFTWILDTEPSL